MIVDGGKQLQILRDNMPFGRPGHGEFGTYFIGYCRTPRVTELMLENMFIGRPPGNYDRLLDFSHAVTGGLFFVPSATFLDNLDATAPDSATSGASPASNPLPQAPPRESLPETGSLNIGSLKGEKDE
jgi:putative iron-dependent peroxidase